MPTVAELSWIWTDFGGRCVTTSLTRRQQRPCVGRWDCHCKYSYILNGRGRSMFLNFCPIVCSKLLCICAIKYVQSTMNKAAIGHVCVINYFSTWRYKISFKMIPMFLRVWSGRLLDPCSFHSSCILTVRWVHVIVCKIINSVEFTHLKNFLYLMPFNKKISIMR